MDILAEILSSRVRAAIFELLFVTDFPSYHMRELERRSSCAIGTIQTELKKLHRLNLVERIQDGNRVNFRANRTHPLCPVICDLVSKSTGIEAVLQEVLSEDDRIQSAFIFGSAVRGELQPDSDVDLMVVGHLGLRDLMGLLSGVSERIGREINPHVIDPSELTRRLQDGDHFLRQLLNTERTYLVGGNDELTTLGR